MAKYHAPHQRTRQKLGWIGKTLKALVMSVFESHKHFPASLMRAMAWLMVAQWREKSLLGIKLLGSGVVRACGTGTCCIRSPSNCCRRCNLLCA